MLKRGICMKHFLNSLTFKLIIAIISLTILVFNVVRIVDDITDETSDSKVVKENINEDNNYDAKTNESEFFAEYNVTSDSEYYSLIEPTDNGGLRFNLTLEEYIDKYNMHVDAQYRLNYSDFKYNQSGTNHHNNIPIKQYFCNKTVMNRNDVYVMVYIESESNKISHVQIGINRDTYLSLSKDEQGTLLRMRMYVSQALIDEIENAEDFIEIHELMTENSENNDDPAAYVKGVFFTYYIQDNTSLFEWIPWTEEKYNKYREDSGLYD